MPLTLIDKREKSLRWLSKVGRGQVDHDDGTTEQVSLDALIAAWDMTRVEQPWVLYKNGQAPHTVSGSSPRPTPEYQAGLRVWLYSDKLGWRVMMTTSMPFRSSIKKVYDEWEEQRDQHPGELPVIAFTDTTAIETDYGTIYKPELKIVGWQRVPASRG